MAPPPTARRLVWLLAFVSLVGYALRTNITIAQEFMAPALGLTMTQMGIISAWGFQLAYALFQLPGGFLGDRFGARAVLGVAIVGWGVASAATGLVGGGASLAFALLFGARVLLGAAEGALYPIAALATVRHVPSTERLGATSLWIASAAVGMALAPLTLAPLMVAAGWRAVFVASAVVAFLTAGLWFALAPRDTPAGGTVAQPAPPRLPVGVQLRQSLALLREPRLLLLSASYFLHSAVFFVFVFWFFRYLTEGRGFSVLAGGVWGSVPHLMACVLAPLVGRAADALARRGDPTAARRRVAMGCLLVAATFVLVGANAPSAVLAILALGLSESCLISAEAPFWTSATALAPNAPGAAGGVLNLMGNLGGVVSIWLVPVMTAAWGWSVVLSVWAGVAIIAALLWLAVREPTAPAR
jgi:ACS family glucarate transporter-like MFS transporter